MNDPKAPSADRATPDGGRHVLGPLANADKPAVKTWLGDGLRAFFLGLPTESPSAFEPLSRFILRSPVDLADDLKDVYDLVPLARQGIWRQAVTDLLAELPTLQEHVPVFETLLSLARAMPAYEVLPVLPTRAGNGQFGTLRTEEDVPLSDRIFIAALDLTARTQEAATCLRLLIDRTPDFNRAYSPLALTSLCRADPDHWFEHLVLLGTWIQEQHTNHPSELAEEDLSFLAADLIAIVGVDRITKRFHELNQTPPNDWFAKGLFFLPGHVLDRDIYTEEVWEKSSPSKRFVLLMERPLLSKASGSMARARAMIRAALAMDHSNFPGATP